MPTRRNRQVQGSVPGPWEVDAFDAREAFSSGRALTLANYFSMAAEAISLITSMRMTAIAGTSLDRLLTDAIDVPEDWDGSFLQIQISIQRQDMIAIASFLDDHAQVLNRLGAAFHADRAQWHLQFKRCGRGRPPKGEAEPAAPEAGSCDQIAGQLRRCATDMKDARAQNSSDGAFLAEHSAFLRLLSLLLGPRGHNGWRLDFVRRGGGRRTDPAKFWRALSLAGQLQLATNRAHGKQALHELKERGVSRATAFRAKRYLRQAFKSRNS